MPVPVSDAPQWIVNLSVVLGAVATAITAYLMSRREKKTERPDTAPGTVAVLGGALADPRAIERLCEQLAHNERSTRDGERAVISNTNEIGRANDHLAEIRHLLEARNAGMESDVARMLAAIETSRGKSA